MNRLNEDVKLTERVNVLPKTAVLKKSCNVYPSVLILREMLNFINDRTNRCASDNHTFS